MTLRPYQSEAIEALNTYIATHETNPCVVIPTAGGKSFIMAETIRRWKEAYAPFRCIVLAHRKELVEQNAKELLGIAPNSDVGIYAAGLGRHDDSHTITFASIDSVYNKADAFIPFDVIIVDEAHRIPVKGEGKYRRFIRDEKSLNRNVRIIGFTATPYRMSSGSICHRDYILNDICYEANVADLIRDGYVSKIRSKISDHAPDLNGVHKVAGDYDSKELSKRVLMNGLVHEAVTNAIGILNDEKRKCCVWFCVDVKHCNDVLEELDAIGEKAIAVTGNTSMGDRDNAVEMFRSGAFRHLLNVNVFTEGFNVKQVDAVILLRPTMSKGLYQQMVGRGLRLHPDKEDCLILDYAHCIEVNGPIDYNDNDDVRIEVCQACREAFPRPLGKCPRCGWIIPKKVIEERERVEREKKMHEVRAAQLAILGTQPVEYPVSSVMVSKHVKGDNASLCITYRCGIQTFREWICLDYNGYARLNAEAWWRNVMGAQDIPASVDDALKDIFLGNRILNRTETITVKKDGKYNRIIGRKLK